MSSHRLNLVSDLISSPPTKHTSSKDDKDAVDVEVGVACNELCFDDNQRLRLAGQNVVSHQDGERDSKKTK
jgi:hypothetical protein